MVGLTEQSQWENEIYQIEQTDPVVGGEPNLAQGEGITNVPHLMLANRTAWLKAEVESLQTALSAFRTPDVQAIANNAALDAIDATSIYSAAQGVLNPPLAIGGTIGHTELSDGSAMQQALRITPGGVILTAHARTRRTGVWSAWTATGPDIGDLVIQSHNTVLANRLEANGALRSRSTYADLFARVGTTYGAGDGATTFGTLDARGEFLRGWDNGRGIDIGRGFGSAQGHAIQSHTHTIRGEGGGLVVANEDGNGTSPLASGPDGSAINNRGDSYVSASDITQGNSADETRPRNIAQMVCIVF